VLRSRLVWIAHAKIDDVLTTRPSRGFQIINNVKNIGRQAFDALKIVVQGSVSVSNKKNRRATLT